MDMKYKFTVATCTVLKGVTDSCWGRVDFSLIGYGLKSTSKMIYLIYIYKGKTTENNGIFRKNHKNQYCSIVKKK